MCRVTVAQLVEYRPCKISNRDLKCERSLLGAAFVSQEAGFTGHHVLLCFLGPAFPDTLPQLLIQLASLMVSSEVATSDNKETPPHHDPRCSWGNTTNKVDMCFLLLIQKYRKILGLCEESVNRILALPL